MKRIPLEVYEFAGDLRVMAHFILRVKELSRFVFVNIPIKYFAVAREYFFPQHTF